MAGRYGSGEEFLRQYNAKEAKKDKGKGRGNFDRTPTGDLKLSTSLTKHAHQRIKERGVPAIDALKGTAKSGAIISEDGAKVITVLPESWKKNAGAASMQAVANRAESAQDVRVSSEAQANRPKKRMPRDAEPRSNPIPDEAALPKGHCMLSIEADSSVVGLVLGKSHSRIKKMTESRLGTKYWFSGEGGRNIVTVWGPENKARGLLNDIDIIVSNAKRANGPEIPKQLPPGQVKRCIFVPESSAGHVVGKGKAGLMKLRDEHPATSINFDTKTRAMTIWGETTAVDGIVEVVSDITKMAEKNRAREKAKIEKAGKKSHSNKMSQYEKDLAAFAKAGARKDKQGQGQQTHPSKGGKPKNTKKIAKEARAKQKGRKK